MKTQAHNEAIAAALEPQRATRPARAATTRASRKSQAHRGETADTADSAASNPPVAPTDGPQDVDQTVERAREVSAAPRDSQPSEAESTEASATDGDELVQSAALLPELPSDTVASADFLLASDDRTPINRMPPRLPPPQPMRLPPPNDFPDGESGMFGKLVATGGVFAITALAIGTAAQGKLPPESPDLQAQTVTPPLWALSADQIAALPVQDIVAQQPADLMLATSQQLGALTAAQVAVLTPRQLDAFTPQQVVALGEDVGRLAVQTLLSLDDAQLAALMRAGLLSFPPQASISTPNASVGMFELQPSADPAPSQPYQVI